MSENLGFISTIWLLGVACCAAAFGYGWELLGQVGLIVVVGIPFAWALKA